MAQAHCLWRPAEITERVPEKKPERGSGFLGAHERSRTLKTLERFSHGALEGRGWFDLDRTLFAADQAHREQYRAGDLRFDTFNEGNDAGGPTLVPETLDDSLRSEKNDASTIRGLQRHRFNQIGSAVNLDFSGRRPDPLLRLAGLEEIRLRACRSAEKTKMSFRGELDIFLGNDRNTPATVGRDLFPDLFDDALLRVMRR